MLGCGAFQAIRCGRPSTAKGRIYRAGVIGCPGMLVRLLFTGVIAAISSIC
jgi:hypothetical protein